MLNSSQVLAVRSRFPVLASKIYLNSCSQGALSDAVEDGFREYIASWHAHGSPWDIWVERYEAARSQFATFIGATAGEVAVVPYASAGINSVASALTFDQRKKIVLGEFEFPTMGHIWLAQQKRGAKVEFVSAVGDRIPTAGYERAIDRNTLIVPVTGICFMNGFRSAVREIVQLAHANGALVMLDDYQDCGTRRVNVRSADLDFYVTGTLKYLLGPPGLAVPNIYAAMRGISLLQEIGLDNVSEHIAGLVRALMMGAHKLGLRAKTPADSVGPLCVLQCKDAGALVQKLSANGIVCSSRHDGLRLSFHVYNTLDDVASVLHVLERNLDLLVIDTTTMSAD
jgi:selenocysteine lyase/cysteine desulfurase